MNLKNLYARSLKNISSEEIFDLILFRPLGFITAYLLRKTPVTPNWVTVASMFFGILSGMAFYFVSYESGALLLLGANILDCSDGQLARMKGTSSKIGRILDGFADYVTYVAVYTGMTFAWMRDTGDFYWFWIGWFLAVSTIIQAAIFDDYRNRFIGGESMEEMKEEAESFRNLQRETENPLKKFLYFMYAFYTNKQIRFREKNQNRRISPLFMRLLTFLGSTTHITLLVVFAFLKRLDLYYITVSVVLNVYLALLMIFQKKINYTKEA
jgi:phosphatidylserine synthase